MTTLNIPNSPFFYFPIRGHTYQPQDQQLSHGILYKLFVARLEIKS